MLKKYRASAVLAVLMLIVALGAPSFAGPTPGDAVTVYDPRETLNDIRNQGSDNVSYAFVTMAMAEIALSNAGYDEDLSEQYMRYAMSKDGSNALGFSQAYDASPSFSIGGYAIAAYLLRGEMGGIVLEDEDPYGSAGARQASETESKQSLYRIGDVILFDDMAKNADDTARDNRIDQLKQAIEDYGAVGGWVYSAKTTTAASSSNSYWYNDNLLLKYPGGTNVKTANWCIALVGWDDGYDDGEGAFIARNSWGEIHGPADDKSGYFYLSYLDYYLLRSAFAVDNPISLGDEGIDATYEHDPFGISAINSLTDQNSVWMANAFTVTGSGQNARYVSFAVPHGNVDYEVYIAPVGEDGATAALQSIGSGAVQPVATSVISFENTGYYTVEIDDECLLGAAGTQFVVAVKLTGTGKIAVEQKNGTNSATASEGQSYTSVDGAAWDDISGKSMNACIKVLTEDEGVTRPAAVILNTNNLTLKLDDPDAGPSATLIATVQGTEGKLADQSVIWSSSNSKIAKVDENGVVTALKAGTCNITARAVVGGKKAVCTVTVPNIEVESVTLSANELTIKTNEQKTLSAKCLPSNASDLTVKWSSGNENIATVSSVGVVKGLAPGVATITAISTITPDKYDICVVTVEQDYATSLTLDKKSVRLSVGSSVPVKLTVKPATAYDQSVTWTTIPEDSDVAEINNDIIVAKNCGTVTLVATANTAKEGETAPSARIEVTVYDGADIYCNVGKTVKFNSTLTVSDASKLEWTVYNMSDGLEASKDNIEISTNKLVCTVKGKAEGEYRIVIQDPDNDANTQTVRVGVKVPVKKVSAYLPEDEEKKKIRRTEITVDQDGGNPGTVQLYSAVLPEDVTYTDVKWKSSKPNVATVDEKTGLVTAVGPGSTSISCTSVSDSKKGTFTVVVKYNSKTLTLNKTELLISKGRTASVKATVDKIKNVSKVIEWSSSDDTIVAVNNKGKMTAVGLGTAVITARTLGGVEQTVEVVGAILPTKVTVNAKKLQLTPGGEGAQIVATVMPSDTTLTGLTYEVRDSTVADVDETGYVTPKKAGTTTVTIYTENNKKVKVTVQVK